MPSAFLRRNTKLQFPLHLDKSMHAVCAGRRGSVRQGPILNDPIDIFYRRNEVLSARKHVFGLLS